MQDKKPETKASENDSVTVPTMEGVRRAIKEAIEEHIQTRDHPYATLEDRGFVTLSNEVESDSEITVATSRAVKKAYDLASKANSSNNYVPTSRRVNGKALSSDITLNASDVGAYTKEETDSQINNATSLANTANQKASKANDNANTRLAKDQNGADIPNKEKFVKNLGLSALMEGIALPVGVPVPWPTETPPEGWLICNGDSFDKAKYPKLAIAYPSGKLPDLRAEFIRGADAGRGIDPTINVLSAKPSQIQSHTHDYRDRYYSENNGSIDGATNWEWQPDGYNNSLGSGSTDNDNNTFLYYNGTTSSTGGTETHPRYIAFLYIVKAA